MPWFQFLFTNGEKYIQGEMSTDRLAVKKRLMLSAEEYMIRIDLSSHKDKGYSITGIKTNVKYYPFKCGQSTIALDVPPGGKHLIIGLAGNLQTSADSTYFINIQALHLHFDLHAPTHLVPPPTSHLQETKTVGLILQFSRGAKFLGNVCLGPMTKALHTKLFCIKKRLGDLVDAIDMQQRKGRERNGRAPPMT